MAGLTVDGFYDLTPNADVFVLTPGLLVGSPQGMRALDGDDAITGSLDPEVINGNQGVDFISGGGGNDYLRGGRDEDFVAGEAGDDILNGNIGADLVNGGEGNDIVRGGRDNDVLAGGIGNDTLIGDVGADVLAGNEGSDLFALRTEIATTEEADLILDFNPLEDRIGLTKGVTEAALQLQEAVLPLDLLAGFVGIGAADIVTLFQDTTGVNIDPDGDRLVNITTISQGQNTLAIAFNTTQAALRGRFVSLSDADVAIG